MRVQKLLKKHTWERLYICKGGSGSYLILFGLKPFLKMKKKGKKKIPLIWERKSKEVHGTDCKDERKEGSNYNFKIFKNILKDLFKCYFYFPSLERSDVIIETKSSDYKLMMERIAGPDRYMITSLYQPYSFLFVCFKIFYFFN